MYEGFNKDTEFTKVNPVKLLTSGKITSEDIGRTVYLSNSATACQEWRVADINHDGTSGTVDLFPKYVLSGDEMAWRNNYTDDVYCSGSNDPEWVLYPNSIVREWLNGSFLNGFNSNIRNAIRIQSVQCKYTGHSDITLSDKVKCPSVTEMAIDMAGNTTIEGTAYPIFGSTTNGGLDKPAVVYYTTDLKDATYWVRSVYGYYKNMSVCVVSGGRGFVAKGYIYTYPGTVYKNSVIGCIRF